MILENLIDNTWRPSRGSESLLVRDPARGCEIARVASSTREDVDEAARSAERAYRSWRGVPAGERVQVLFRLKTLLEAEREELARTLTLECGKTLDEARAELVRAIENVEMACGAPALLQGDYSEDIARGIDEYFIRQPLGVCACLVPFNFPAMIPFWFLPYAVACGNSLIVKTSERTPLTMQRVGELLKKSGLPAGVVNLVHGGRETSEALIDHPLVRAVSFVGSSVAAKSVYARAAAAGKRVQCQGGAKNPVVILPDADPELTVRIVADSAFGCAGQRCLAASLALTVGEASQWFPEAIAAAADQRVVGSGLDAGVQMGPVISSASRARLTEAIGQAEREGARRLAGGGGVGPKASEEGFFVRPTVLENLPPDSPIASEELFGPVLGLLPIPDVQTAVARINAGRYGNMACLFTRDGASARFFRSEVEAGNIGINIGIAAPMAFFPFSGWKESFFGDLHAQGRHAIEFYTQTKVVVERWPRVWSRTF